MPADFNGYWKMVSNDNFEEYLKALDVNVAVRKIANLLKPDKEILQNGDHMIIKTLSTFRNYIMEFDVGKEFEEDLSGVDDRKCMVGMICHWKLVGEDGTGKPYKYDCLTKDFKNMGTVSKIEMKVTFDIPSLSH